MTIAYNLEQVLHRIAKSVKKYRFNGDQVRLVAVSKKKSADQIKMAWEQGQKIFGESYVQEALEKIDLLAGCDIEWHFIGPIQSNKTSAIATNFDWCQSVDRSKIARRLSAQRPVELPPLNICIQLNISSESSKSGTDIESLWSLAEEIDQLPGIILRGLMAIPERHNDFSRQREVFAQMYDIFAQLQSRYDSVDTLSMGMSNDMEAAIAEGSTMVRVGTDIFGARE